MAPGDPGGSSDDPNSPPASDHRSESDSQSRLSSTDPSVPYGEIDQLHNERVPTTLGLFRDPRKSEKAMVAQAIRERLGTVTEAYDPAKEFEEIIKHFKPAKPFGGSGRERSPENFLSSVHKIARSYKGSGRAFRILTTAYERFVEHAPAAQITAAQREETLLTFPEGPAVEISIPDIGGGLADSIHFDADSIAQIIQRMPDGKGQGPSGLGSTHIRAIAK